MNNYKIKFWVDWDKTVYESIRAFDKNELNLYIIEMRRSGYNLDIECIS